MADKWKVPCTTEGVDVYTWADSAPTECPNDSAHTINSGGVEKASSLEFRFEEENGAQTTTLETFQNAATLTPTLGLGKGVYRMSWTCELRISASGALNSRVQTRFRIDSTTKNNTVTLSEEWQCHSGWDRYFADEDEKPVLTLDYRRDPNVGGDDTVEIRKVRLGIEYIGTN